MAHRAQVVAANVLHGCTAATAVHKALKSAEAAQLQAALTEDARDAVYSGLLTIAEAVQGLDRHLYTWSTVKLYYSVFYLARAMLAATGVGLFYVNRTPFVWKASAGEHPEKRSGTTHATVLQAYAEFAPGSLLLSQTIGVEEPFEWLTSKREYANYKEARFSEPTAPAHFSTAEKYGVRRVIGDYVADAAYLFAFDPDHAMLAFPIETTKLAIATLSGAGALDLTQDDAGFLASQCFDRKGPISDFRRLITGS